MLSASENQDISFYRGYAEGMLEVNDSVTLIAAALSMMDKSPEAAAPVELTEARQPSRPVRKSLKEPRKESDYRPKSRSESNYKPKSRSPKAYGDKKVGTGFSRRR